MFPYAVQRGMIGAAMICLYCLLRELSLEISFLVLIVLILRNSNACPFARTNAMAEDNMVRVSRPSIGPGNFHQSNSMNYPHSLSVAHQTSQQVTYSIYQLSNYVCEVNTKVIRD